MTAHSYPANPGSVAFSGPAAMTQYGPYADDGKKEGPTARRPRASSFTTALRRKLEPDCGGPVTLPRFAWLKTSSRDASLGERRYSARTQ